jgi:hypothetical protein
MLPDSIVARIQNEVACWPGVTVEVHRGGMVFFQMGRREIGHLHGSRFADYLLHPRRPGYRNHR